MHVAACWTRDCLESYDKTQEHRSTHIFHIARAAII